MRLLTRHAGWLPLDDLRAIRDGRIHPRAIARDRRHGSRPVIGYVGCLGHGNLGDEVMFEAARRIMAARARLVPLQPHLTETILALAGRSGDRFFDGLILGGGTLISPGWAQRVTDALKMGVPIWTLGTGAGSAGFGDVPNPAMDVWSPILRKFSAVGVRGPLSQERLARLGIDEASVIGDLACTLVVERPVPASGDRIAVNWAGQEAAGTRHALVDHLRLAVQDGATVVPVATDPTDLVPLHELMIELGLPDTGVNYTSSFSSFKLLVETCTYSVNMRLHATVLSHCLGVPALAIAYRDKVIDYMASVGETEWCVSTTDVDSMAEKLGILHATAPDLRGAVVDEINARATAIRTYADGVLSRVI